MLLHGSLLAGLLLIGVPIVLHLVMRQRPKPLVFPALQFVRRRRDANRRTLRLRHWLLLLLRCLAIGLIVVALMRPHVASAELGNWILVAVLGALLALFGWLLLVACLKRRGPWVIAPLAVAALALLAGCLALAGSSLARGSHMLLGSQEAPVSAILVIDTSPRMDYRHDVDSRLQQAQAMADWLIRQLPPDSQVAVLDSRPRTPVYANDQAAARAAVERLQTTSLPRSLPAVLLEALDLAQQAAYSRREIYTLTDLTEPSWPADQAELLGQRLASASDVGLYVIDIGQDDARNVGLGDVHLISETLPPSGELVVETDVFRHGPGGTSHIELYVERPDVSRPYIQDGHAVLPEPERRQRESIDIPADGSQHIRLHATGFEPGIHQGFVKLVDDDGLLIDNVRYFAFQVTQARPVLIAAPNDVNTSGFSEVLAPFAFRKADNAEFACTVIDQDALPRQDWDTFDAICLLDPRPLDEALWPKLEEYVRSGRGLAIFLGHHAGADAAGWQSEAAQKLLPGRLGLINRASEPLYLAPQTYDHPVLAAFGAIATGVPWSAFPVFRYWTWSALAADAHVVLRFGDGQPALVERTLGTGRVLVMMTPITEPDRPAGRASWNGLAGPEDWPRFLLVQRTARYLAGSRDAHLNFFVGQTVSLPNRAETDPVRYQLFAPSGELQSVSAQNDRITIRATDQPGAYRLKGDRSGPVSRGFAVNVPAEATQLARIDRSRLDTVLGHDRYEFAREQSEIRRVQGYQRAGREFYPFLVALLAIVLGAEHVLANRFYGPASRGSSVRAVQPSAASRAT